MLKLESGEGPRVGSLLDLLTDVASGWTGAVCLKKLREWGRSTGWWPTWFSGRNGLWLVRGYLPEGAVRVRKHFDFPSIM